MGFFVFRRTNYLCPVKYLGLTGEPIKGKGVVSITFLPKIKELVDENKKPLQRRCVYAARRHFPYSTPWVSMTHLFSSALRLLVSANRFTQIHLPPLPHTIVEMTRNG